MRKYLLIFLAVLLAGCIILAGLLFYMSVKNNKITSNGETKPPAYNIHVIFKAYQSAPDFWWVAQQGVEVAAEEFNVDCFITGATSEDDIEGQIKIMRQSIEMKPDAIILAASDYKLLAPACEEATKAGIKLIILDSDVNASKKSAFISTDNYEVGRKLATLLEELSPPDSSFAVIGHVETTSTARDRLRGFYDEVENIDNRLLSLEYCDGSVEKAKKIAIELLEKYPDIDCLVGLNETSSLGISYALAETGKAGEVVHIACDSSRDQIEFMENGTVQAFVIQNPFNMGYLSVETAVKVLEGKKTEYFIDTGSVIIKKEDMYKPENQKLLFPYNDSAIEN